MASEYQPTADDVRAVRAFKMPDTDLAKYINLALTSSYEIENSLVIPAAARKDMLALLAAHLATVLREPEPTSVRFGSLQTNWVSAGSLDGLEGSAPGREFKQRWRRYNAGRVLR